MGDIICKGCGRSEKQIREWHGYTNLEKKTDKLINRKKISCNEKD